MLDEIKERGFIIAFERGNEDCYYDLKYPEWVWRKVPEERRAEAQLSAAYILGQGLTFNDSPFNHEDIKWLMAGKSVEGLPGPRSLDYQITLVLALVAQDDARRLN